jgi:hypothetical protein
MSTDERERLGLAMFEMACPGFVWDDEIEGDRECFRAAAEAIYRRGWSDSSRKNTDLLKRLAQYACFAESRDAESLEWGEIASDIEEALRG